MALQFDSNRNSWVDRSTSSGQSVSVKDYTSLAPKGYSSSTGSTTTKAPCSSCSGSGCGSCGGTGESKAQLEIARGQLKLAQQANAIAQDQYKHSLTFRPVEKAMISDVKAGYDPNFYGAKERNVPLQQLAANIMVQAKQGSQRGVSATSPSAVINALGTGGFAGYQAGTAQTAAQVVAKEKTDQGGLKAAAIGQQYPEQVTQGFGSASGIAGKASDIAYQAASAAQAASNAARADAWARRNAEMAVWQNEQLRAQDLQSQQELIEASRPKPLFGTHICTEMYEQSFINKNDLDMSVEYAKTLSKYTYNGYSLWAKPFAIWLKKHPIAARITASFTKQYIDEITYGTNVRGRIILAIGKPICFMIGKIYGEKK